MKKKIYSWTGLGMVYCWRCGNYIHKAKNRNHPEDCEAYCRMVTVYG